MNVTPKSTNNLGGIAKVWAIPSSLADITRQPAEPNSFFLPDEFTLECLEILPIFQSLRFSETSKTESGGTYYESTLSLSIARDSPALKAYLEDLQSGRWSLLTLDQNGLYRLIGSKAYPLRVGIARNTGAEISDLNHIRLEFTGTSPYPSIFMSNPF